VAARVEFEHATLRAEGAELAAEPPRIPTIATQKVQFVLLNVAM